MKFMRSVVSFTVCCLLWAPVTTIQAATANRRTFLPAIVLNVDTSATTGDADACGALKPEEASFIALMRAAPEQRRPSLLCSAALSRSARQHAQEMVDMRKFTHLGPTGAGPNVRARSAGFALPAWYSSAADANNIESIAGGQPTAQIAWRDLMGSAPHRDHLLGLVDMYRNQTRFGMAYLHAPNGEFVDYWVVVTAQRD